MFHSASIQQYVSPLLDNILTVRMQQRSFAVTRISLSLAFPVHCKPSSWTASEEGPQRLQYLLSMTSLEAVIKWKGHI